MGSRALIELSLTLLIACIGVKEWRAWKVRFNSLNFQQVHITNKFVYSVIAAIVAVTLILLIINFVAQPPSPDACQEYFCSTGTWFYIFWAYLVLLNIGAIVLAFIARDVPSVAGESSSILHVSLFSIFSMVLVTIAFLVESLGNDLKVFLLGFVLFWVSLCYIALIVFRKLAWVGYSAADIRTLFLGEKQNTAFYSSATTGRDFAESGPGVTSSSPTDVQSNSTPTSVLGGAADFQKTKLNLSTPEESSDTSDRPASFLSQLQRSAGGSTSGDSTLSEAPSSVPHPISQADQKRAKAFLIGSKNGWEEYVDRDSGASFWIEETSERIVYSAPTEVQIQVTEA